jgi:tyrosinase
MLHPTVAFVVGLLLTAPATPAAAGGCTHRLVRKEWRTLSRDQKSAYIDAVRCLQSQPGRTQHLYPGVRSRYDDYVGTHINITDLYHFSGPFQPWHRMMVQSYESDLRQLCGYTGAQPYWDWTLDADTEQAFLDSPLFDPITGFGGNGPYVNTTNMNNTNLGEEKVPGKTGGGCVPNGPFVNLSVNMGPGNSTAYNPRCLKRDFSPYLVSWTLNSSLVNWVLAADSYAVFDLRAQGDGISVWDMTYHGGGHAGVGGDTGDIGNPYSSPGDPLFYLHHANMDRLWDKWQRADWPARKTDIAGPDVQFAYPWNFFGDIPYSNVTLDYEMDFMELLGTKRFVTIGEVMDITAPGLCYTYDE